MRRKVGARTGALYPARTCDRSKRQDAAGRARHGEWRAGSDHWRRRLFQLLHAAAARRRKHDYHYGAERTGWGEHPDQAGRDSVVRAAAGWQYGAKQSQAALPIPTQGNWNGSPASLNWLVAVSSSEARVYVIQRIPFAKLQVP